VVTHPEAVIRVSKTVRDYILHKFPDTPAERIHGIPRFVGGEF
jgi:hypothetical protein